MRVPADPRHPAQRIRRRRSCSRPAILERLPYLGTATATGGHVEWYPFYPLDFERDTAHLTLEQEAVYRRLIDWYMIHGGAPADDDRALANIARVSQEVWAGMAEIIRAFFVSTGTRLQHARCEHELNVQTQRKKRDATIKRKQRQAKLLKQLNGGVGGLSENVHQMSSDKTRQDSIEEANASSPPIAPQVYVRRNLVDLSAWEPTEEDRAYAREWGQDPDRVLTDIRGWCANAPASKSRKKDPSAFWQGWCRRAADHNRPAPARNGGWGSSGNGQGAGGVMEAVARVVARKAGRGGL